MQIVINIPDDIYEDIMSHNGENREGAKSAYYFESLIKNGTSLPSGHGDLIDKNELIKNGVATKDYLNTFIDTIIEADNKEE